MIAYRMRYVLIPLLSMSSRRYICLHAMCGKKLDSRVLSPSPTLAHRLPRKATLDPLPFHELLEVGVELQAVLLRDDGCGIGGFDGIGVAVAGDHLGSHHVHNRFEQAIVEHRSEERRVGKEGRSR